MDEVIGFFLILCNRSGIVTGQAKEFGRRPT